MHEWKRVANQCRYTVDSEKPTNAHCIFTRSCTSIPQAAPLPPEQTGNQDGVLETDGAPEEPPEYPKRVTFEFFRYEQQIKESLDACERLEQGKLGVTESTPVKGPADVQYFINDRQ
eukprot:5897209-Karenia_brevis.AAC.1